ncbi:hypothetical protein GCM10011490_21200 [Pseudoclavibacter endophyticus]|uniref:Uncharacterized protein n=1 Tax=Pseudoclavibacter endophyticus TaxID=1778590 RepID=A0A6H9WPY5_9MICO|nr:hypothetical protein [Pseudoclavibacter endophyticus]KAB1648171.1 hypothetical protein F8O04_10665 [Pseudoclavibacter endophyticus]GGA70315.1 hypothetical protein GCM10011490_21200 [Pseudoclavibacter endophyticus]
MVDDARIQDCHRRIAEGWLPLMPEGQWSVSYLFWAPAGKAVYTETTAIDREGKAHPLSQPPAVHEALHELRDAMSDPQRGAWISSEFKLTDDGVLEASFNWDRRFYWGVHAGSPWAPDPDPDTPDVPDDNAFVDELERYPREHLFLPAWYPRHRVVDGERLDDAALDPRRADPDHHDRFETPRNAAVSLPDEVKPLQDAWGWPGVFASINDAVLGNMDRREGREADALLGETGDHERDAALDALIDDAVASTMLVLDRSPALASVRLLREWLAVRGERGPANLEAANRGDALAALLDRTGEVGDAARVTRARLESIVRLVVEDNVDDRFDAVS